MCLVEYIGFCLICEAALHHRQGWMTESRFHKKGLINCHSWNWKLRSHLSWPTLNLAPWYLSFSGILQVFLLPVLTANRSHAFCQAKTSWPIHSMWMVNGTHSASVYLWRNSHSIGLIYVAWYSWLQHRVKSLKI